MPAWQNRPAGPKAHPLVLHRPVQKKFYLCEPGHTRLPDALLHTAQCHPVWEASMRRKSTEQSSRPEVSSGEIIVGLAWVVLYIVLVASDWARDAIVLLAERAPSELF